MRSAVIRKKALAVQAFFAQPTRLVLGASDEDLEAESDYWSRRLVGSMQFGAEL